MLLVIIICWRIRMRGAAENFHRIETQAARYICKGTALAASWTFTQQYIYSSTGDSVSKITRAYFLWLVISLFHYSHKVTLPRGARDANREGGGRGGVAVHILRRIQIIRYHDFSYLLRTSFRSLKEKENPSIGAREKKIISLQTNSSFRLWYILIHLIIYLFRKNKERKRRKNVSFIASSWSWCFLLLHAIFCLWSISRMACWNTSHSEYYIYSSRRWCWQKFPTPICNR